MAVAAARHCAAELATLAEKLLDRVPDKPEWEPVRKLLQDTITFLKEGNISAGMTAVQRVLPYVEKVMNNVDRYVKVSDIYQITETLTEHFLVDEAAKQQIADFLSVTKEKLDELRKTITQFAVDLDDLLREVITGQQGVTFYIAVKLAFRMNRISGDLASVEWRLQCARRMLDDLDTHLASKNLLASLLSAVCFLGSIALSAMGNLPAGAACLATATATHKSAQGLGEYRKHLAELDAEHSQLQAELAEWRFRFQAEQRNFLLLAGCKYCLLLLLVLACSFLLLGKAANFLTFAVISIYLVIKAEKTNMISYYAGVGLAVLALIMQYQKYQGLAMFNTGATIFFVLEVLGFLEII